VERNPGCTPLMPRHQLGVPLARFRQTAFRLERLDCLGGGAVGFAAGGPGWLRTCHELRPDL
jgi:hypothetical protein